MQDSNRELTKPKRKHWIDLLRGFCMVAILLDHTEIYYTGDNIIGYNYYVANVLVAFFFLSGYLFYKEKPFSLRHKLTYIARYLLLPYFLFTTFIAIPKAFAHDFDISDTLFSVLTGQASWFVAALIVAEIVFSTVLWACKSKTWGLSILALAASAACYLLSTHCSDLYWQIENACMALPILCFGYFYHKWESVFHRFHNLSSSFFLFILLVIIKVYEHTQGITLLVEPIRINNWYIFVFDALVCTLFLVSLAKQLKSVAWLEWTGRRSLVYYFFSGGIPLIVSALLQRTDMGYSGHYHRVLLAFLLVYALTSIIAWAVYRYLGFIVQQPPKAADKA